MVHATSTSQHNPDVLRQDLGTEYYAILGIVNDFDHRLMVVKGWSVTLSLASLGSDSSKATTPFLRLAAELRWRSGSWT